MEIKHILMGGIGTNTYIVSSNQEAFIVDPAAEPEKIEQYIDDAGLTPVYIILTHGHGDHIGAVPDLMSYYPELKLAAGADERELLMDEEASYAKMITGRDMKLDPDVVLHDGDILHVGDMKLRIITTPGHTRGGICIHVDDTLFSGDTLFHASIGRTDLPGGDYGQIIASIKDKLYRLPDDTTVLPGHMQSTTIGYEKKHNPFV